MELQAIDQAVLARRSFLAWGGRLAVAGATTAFVPAALWARAAEKYPTIKAQFDAYVLSKKLPGLVAAIGHAAAKLHMVIGGGNKTGK